MLRSYARQAGPQALAAAAGPQAAVLAQLLPELGPVQELTGSGDATRLTLFDAVGAVLDRASRAAPLAVVLDDLHAAGRPSALLLRFASAARLSRVLLLATYRTAEAALDPDVSDVIAALESASPPLVLAGLSAGDIRLMLPGADADVLAVVQRLTALDEELAEAEAWHDTERASRLRAEKDFLVRELIAATGLGGRPRRLGAESERARLNVARAIRSAIAKIRDRAPAAAAHLDRSVRTGTRCSYSPPGGSA